MSYTTEDIASALKAARESKGLSQRELSRKAGVPQGHISKIEKGVVDLRLSSLIALARALDLELTLVPRKTVAAVRSIVRNTGPPASGSSEETRLAFKELKRLQETLASLPKINRASTELAQLQRQIRELQHFQLSRSDLETIRSAQQAFKVYMDSHNLDAIRESLSQLKNLRNAYMHGIASLPQLESVRPAYSLDEDDRG